MKRFELKNGYAVVSVDDMNEDELVLDIVEVKEKRQGTGTELVNMVIEYAREQGKTLTLCAYPQDDSIELEDLVSFYEELGFGVDYDDGAEVLMSID